MQSRKTRAVLSNAVLAVALLAPRLALAGGAACACDCNADRRVAVGELVTAVSISLERAALAVCSAADHDRDGRVAVGELIAGVRAALQGCDGATPTPTPDPQIPPSDAAALLAWLQAGNYLEWTAESAPHPSGGPHFGRVRTYLNDALFASLTAGDEAHPAGAAAVKELYGGSGDEVRGWSVSIKTAAASAGGANWYWLEHFNGNSVAAGQGIGLCTGCHSQNYRTFTSKDLVLIPFPLQ